MRKCSECHIFGPRGYTRVPLCTVLVYKLSTSRVPAHRKLANENKAFANLREEAFFACK